MLVSIMLDGSYKNESRIVFVIGSFNLVGEMGI